MVFNLYKTKNGVEFCRWRLDQFAWLGAATAAWAKLRSSATSSKAYVAQTPKDPRALVAEAEDTVEFLRRLEGDPPAPSRGVSMDPGVVAADLEVKHRRLETVLDELEAADLGVRAAREEAEAALARAERVGPLGRAGDRGAGGVGGGRPRIPRIAAVIQWRGAET